MKLIAFAGRAGSGKNTAARGLSAHYETSELAMADPLYDALGTLIGLSPFDDNDLRTLCEDRDFKRAAHKALGGLSPRAALQQLGDWVRNSLGQDFLLRRAEERLAILEDFQFQVDLAVVTDVRTEREAAWVREHGGLLIHVSRDEQRQGSTEDVPAHSTENPLTLAQGDGYVFNNGTVEDLHAAVHQVVLCWAYGVAA